ncbi:MAG: NADH:ubiquinone oxidoreductase [Bacteroidetes bacterium]|nr:NADH:ubiquinone oxidoreductase [Bacteroidota bacterium]
MNYIVEENILDLVNDGDTEYALEHTNDITYEIIGAAMEVYNTLGKGFMESVYKDCLSIEFEKRNLGYQREKKFEVFYKGIKIPHFYLADFIIEDRIILEIKAQNLIIEENIKQTINYLAVSKCRIGLLINFGDSSLKYKRVILTK